MSEPKSKNEIAIQILEKFGIDEIIIKNFLSKEDAAIKADSSKYKFSSQQNFEKALNFYLENLKKVLNFLD